MSIPSWEIKHVSDTALWAALFRVMESDRPDALFHDPLARILVGERGDEILRTITETPRLAWSVIIRTRVLDELILKLVQENGVDTVINLAAGLDSRPYRLPLPTGLRWIEVDLPIIIDYKEQQLRGEQPRIPVERFKLDLTDETARAKFFAQIGSEAKQALIITEGLLVYLEPTQVAGLAAALHQPPSFRWWLFELASVRTITDVQKIRETRATSQGAPFLFGPEEGTDFFTPYGWKVAEFRPAIAEARRLHRAMPIDEATRALLQSRLNMQPQAESKPGGYTVLERT